VLAFVVAVAVSVVAVVVVVANTFATSWTFDNQMERMSTLELLLQQILKKTY
jgi:hypothetical protein